MNNKVCDLASYSFSPDEKILVDANIWLYLFPAPGGEKRFFVKGYSKAFFALISAKAQPVLDPMVLSEYLNRYCRIEWEGNYKSTYPFFKDFRKSKDFGTVAATAQSYALKILQCCRVHSTQADELDLKQALTALASGQIDFNDALLVNICKKQNFKLMTNDADFQCGGIEVLTTNPKLLKACSS